METAFFEPAGAGVYVATAATVGPWSPTAQHGGPPSALAALALDRHEPDPRQRLARVSIDILRPVPIGKLSLRTMTVRTGRRVVLLHTTIEVAGQEVLHARGWRLERPAGEIPVVGQDATLPGIPDRESAPDFGRGHESGYLSAIEWRFVSGGFRQRRPAAAWTRPRIPLVAGIEQTPMSRALLVADSGSGISSVLDVSWYEFINVDLSVVLTRDPASDWLLMESVTQTGADGAGVARTRLSDPAGGIGHAWQTLLLAPR